MICECPSQAAEANALACCHILVLLVINWGTRGSVLVEALSWKVAGTRPDEIIEFCQFTKSFRPHQDLEFTQRLTKMGTRDTSRKCYWEVECGRCLRLTASLQSLGRLCTQCGILNISRTYKSPRPVTEIALLFLCRMTSSGMLRHVALVRTWLLQHPRRRHSV
jgi:hypothetical protein